MPVPAQTRAVDPYSSYQSNNINKLTRIISAGDDIILDQDPLLDVEIVDSTHIRVTPGSCIKDDVFISVDTEEIVDFGNPAHYEDDTSGVFPTAGIYYIALKYIYAKTKPSPTASIVIITPDQRSTLWVTFRENFLLLKALSVSGGGGSGSVDSLTDCDPENPLECRSVGGGTGGGGGSIIDSITDIPDVPAFGPAGYHLAVNSTQTATIWEAPPELNLVINKYETIAGVGDTIFSWGGWTYTVGAGELVLYINGVRQSSSAFTETSTNSITLTEAVSGGQEILITSLEDSVGSIFTGVYNKEILIATPALQNIILAWQYVPNHVEVYIDGVMQTPTLAFTEVGNNDEIQLGEALTGGQEVLIIGLTSASGGGAGSLSVQSEEQIATAGQTIFTLTRPYTPNQIAIYVNGVRQATGAYNETDIDEITFTEQLAAGDIVLFFYSNDSVTTNLVNKWEAIAGTDTGVGSNVVASLPWTYKPGQIVVYVQGLRQSETSFQQTSNASVTFTGIDLAAGDELLFVSSDDAAGIEIFWEFDGNNDLMPIG